MVVRLVSVLFLFCVAFAPVSGALAGEDWARAMGRGSYTPVGNETRADVLALAAFEAALEATRAAVADLESRDEAVVDPNLARIVFPLAADMGQARVLKQSCPAAGGKCSLEVELILTVKDLVMAEGEAVKARKAASREGFREEMEPTLAAEFNPAKSLARAGAELSLGRFRPAVLYLDRLLARYPNWTSALVCRARVFLAMNEDTRARIDLERACGLGSATACGLLK